MDETQLRFYLTIFAVGTWSFIGIYLFRRYMYPHMRITVYTFVLTVRKFYRDYKEKKRKENEEAARLAAEAEKNS